MFENSNKMENFKKKKLGVLYKKENLLLNNMSKTSNY